MIEAGYGVSIDLIAIPCYFHCLGELCNIVRVAITAC